MKHRSKSAPAVNESLYERLYLFELECRESLVGRLQLSVAILTAFFGLLGFILVNVNPATQVHTAATALFGVSYLVACGLLCGATWHFVRALWGHTYECLPSAIEILKYQATLNEWFKFKGGRSAAKQHHNEFLVRYFAECATKNAKVNELRYEELHQFTSFIVGAVVPTTIAAVTFVLGGFGSSLPG